MIDTINKVIRHPDKAFRELSYRFLSIFGHSDFKHFILLSRSRTGSNMLVSYLNSHPNIRMKREIFRWLKGKNYKDVLVKLFSKQPYYIKAIGCKIFYYHPHHYESNDIWDELISMDNLSVIHLKRRNIFRTLISRKIAGTQNIWIAGSSDGVDPDSNKAVSFTVEELKKDFMQTRDWEKNGDEMFCNHPLRSVYYEDLVSDPQGVLGNIMDFLGVQDMQLITEYRKQNPERLRDIVINYNELKSAFSGSEWELFFDE